MIQSLSPIEEAARSERNWFIATVVWLLVGAAITGLLTVLLYRKTGKSQSAVKADADARIVEAGATASRANADAAKANEGLAKADVEIAKLNADAEKAKTERVEADKQIEIAKADAARAKEGIANAEAQSAKAAVEVERLRIIVANAEKERAEAQKALLDLQERIRPRHLSAEQWQKLLERLKEGPVGSFSLLSVANNPESIGFARELAAVLKEAGWTLLKDEYAMASSFSGIGILVPNPENPRGAHLQKVLTEVGFPVVAELSPKREPDSVLLYVGSKP